MNDMKTGTRFWQLIGLVFLILGGYGLAELHDAVAVKQKQLETQRQLLFREEALLKDNRWKTNLRAVNQVREQWLNYLPVENSAAVAKAHLLSELRSAAQTAGMSSLTVSATDSESVEQAKPATSTAANAYSKSRKDAKSNALPSGVHMIKVNIAGRFDPASFTRLVRVLEEERRFTIVERLSVRSTQLELSVRCYWRLNAAASPGKEAQQNSLAAEAKF